MRVLIVDSSVAYTGAFKCALIEAELLTYNGHTFYFVLPQQSTLKPYVEDKHIKAYMLPMLEISKSIKGLFKYIPRLISNTRKLRKIVKAEQIDVVQMNDFYNMLGFMLRITGYRGKLVTYVRFLPSSRPAPLRKIWSFIAKHFSDRVIAVSKTTLQQLPHSKNAICIYDPVFIEEKLPPKTYVQKQVVDIVYQANYIRGKGQDSALEAFALAHNQNPNIRLTYIGGDMGLDKNKAFKKQLQDRAIELGLENKIHFKGFTQRIEGDIKDADILLNFSESESFSMTCIEASYYGTALIATRCGGPEEIIIDGETGFLVPLHDHQAMANAILKLANSYELRIAFAKAAKKTVMKRFPPEKFVAEMEDALK